MNKIIQLIKKDVLLEWRMKYAIGGIVLYVAIVVFILFLSLQSASGLLWLALFLLILLFAAVNALAKSFINDVGNQKYYFAQLAKPWEILLAKIIYNFILLTVMSFLALGIYILVFQFPVNDLPTFFIGFLLTILSFSTIFTVMSAIAAQSKGSAILMPILSIPVIIPQLLMLIKIMSASVSSTGNINFVSDFLMIIAINAGLIALSFILFGWVWKD